MFKYPETPRAALYDFNVVGSVGGVNYEVNSSSKCNTLISRGGAVGEVS
jgi:hypothetical protein